MSIDFSRLLPLGWSNFFSTQIPLEALDRVRPARVVRVERDRYGVDAGAGEFFATLAGRYRHEHEGEALPTVGDWVLLATDDPVIVQCLERRTLIARRAAGGVERQAVAANIDLLVVVGGLADVFEADVFEMEADFAKKRPRNSTA